MNGMRRMSKMNKQVKNREEEIVLDNRKIKKEKKYKIKKEFKEDPTRFY